MRLKLKRNESGLILESLYQFLGMTRQGVTQRIQGYRRVQQMMSEIGGEIETYRMEHDRRAGSRSVFYNLDLKRRYGLGVTRFERLMSLNEMTIVPMRLKVVTTQSDMQSWNYANLVDGLEIRTISQVVAGDLTYMYIGIKLFYLFCLTDLCSSFLVGMSVSDRMRSQDAQIALQQWIKIRGESAVRNCIHHSDGGKQYFSKDYLGNLKAHDIQISVAKNCMQNGYAEQRNALIKHHFIPCKQIDSLSELRQAIDEIQYFYNYGRKQQALGWRTPAEYEEYLKSCKKDELPRKILFEGRNGRRVLKA